MFKIFRDLLRLHCVTKNNNSQKTFISDNFSPTPCHTSYILDEICNCKFIQ